MKTLFETLFLPENINKPKQSWFTISGIPIGWIIIVISFIVAWIVKLI
jgi:hypothetical protein